MSALFVTGLFASEYTEVIEKWRHDRETRLKGPDGWLSVAGLTWLKNGNNPVSGGIVNVSKGVVTFQSSGRGSAKTLKPDSDDFVVVDGTKLSIIHRGERFGVRIRDNNSKYRKSFTHLDWFPVDPQWRVSAKYIPFKESRKKLFDSQTGDKQEMITPGVLEFTREGRTFRLTPVLEGDELFLIFRDTTAGKTTYPAARFLYSNLPQDGGPVELDFNKAYNPPCVFTPYATCPLPPPENRLTIPVKAGEKMYKSTWH